MMEEKEGKTALAGERGRWKIRRKGILCKKREIELNNGRKRERKTGTKNVFITVIKRER
jgi:hypothetical protein